MPSFNLIHEAWLPVVWQNGETGWIAPWQLTQAHAGDSGRVITALNAPRADFNAALMEFLIGLLSTAYSPQDEGEWQNGWRNPPEPESLRTAMACYDSAFNLDGNGPRFMQDIEPLKGKVEPVVHLLMDEPGSNTLSRNADLFNKRSEDVCMSRAAAAMALYTLQSFAPSGGAGHRTSMRGGGPLSTLALGGHSLWHKVWLNVETQAQIAERGGRLDGALADIFPWMGPTRTSEKGTGRPVTPEMAHPLQVYWGMPRRIRLEFCPAEAGDTCVLAGTGDKQMVRRYITQNYGIEYSIGWMHPLSPYYRQKKDLPIWLPMHPQPGGISYRHWLNLTARDAKDMHRPALAVEHARDKRRRTVGKTSPLRLHASGYDMDNMKARAWTESKMPLFAGDVALVGRLHAIAAECIGGATIVAQELKRQIKAALFERPKEARGDFDFITERFWRQTEADFFALLSEAESKFSAGSLSEQALEDAKLAMRNRWRETLSAAALALFDEYAPESDLEFKDMARQVHARYALVMMLQGSGKAGNRFYAALKLPAPAKKPKQNSQPKEAHHGNT